MEKVKRIVRDASPKAFRTILWIFRITACVSFAMLVLRYTGLLYWIAAAVSPVFHLFGLPGDAAMAYVSGYFINVYSCVAVISTLDLTAREITILGTMTLAAHAMIVETTVQHKTGTPVLYVVLIRTLGSLALGLVMNLLLPGRPDYAASTVSLADVPLFQINEAFGPMFWSWLKGLLRLAAWMTCLIYALNILQRILYEYGLMEKISRGLGPLLRVFGLPAKTSFLWIVTNVIGLSYGAAAIMDEMAQGNISRTEIDLLNTHVGISHSNLEDLLIIAATGGMWYYVLLFRWVMVTVLVWLLRLYQGCVVKVN